MSFEDNLLVEVASVSVGDDPEIVTGQHEISDRELTAIKQCIVTNKELLLELDRMKIDDILKDERLLSSIPGE